MGTWHRMLAGDNASLRTLFSQHGGQAGTTLFTNTPAPPSFHEASHRGLEGAGLLSP